jgi:hypothetical protein
MLDTLVPVPGRQFAGRGDTQVTFQLFACIEGVDAIVAHDLDRARWEVAQRIDGDSAKSPVTGRAESSA